MNPSTSENSEKPLAYSRTEAARRLGISPISIDRLTKTGKLRAVRVLRRPLYPLWELDRFLRDNTKAAY